MVCQMVCIMMVWSSMCKLILAADKDGFNAHVEYKEDHVDIHDERQFDAGEFDDSLSKSHIRMNGGAAVDLYAPADHPDNIEELARIIPLRP